MKKYIAEFIGTFTLVLFGTGVAVFSGGDILMTSLAFGFAIIASAYVIGNISGCHVNPAVSFAMYLSKKIDFKEFLCYTISQILGAFLATSMLYLLLTNIDYYSLEFGANGFDNLSMYGITLLGAAVSEIILTFIFVFTILGVTSDESKSNISGVVIGITLAFVHLLGINLTGTSVNPARSLAPAVFTGGDALSQVWVFIVFPMVGAALAAIVFNNIKDKKSKLHFFRKE